MESTQLLRDCEAIAIPSGEVTVLTKGTDVWITQALGGSYTVHAPDRGLFRIAGKDGDAIGKPVVDAPVAKAPANEAELEQGVLEQLRTCYDPEIPVNIVDLGLVYEVRVAPRGGGRHRVDVKMTLTAPGCGMGASIASEAKQKILGLAGVEDADVQVVWDPPWNPSKISEEGKQKLGIA
ncbi:MAG TPA: putative Fe-S cluster assembly protein SufT [Planctomycetota bacterium]|nr:putative Fe-S cluster assembly protein SufT [Planctomycetota bacterium]